MTTPVNIAADFYAFEQALLTRLRAVLEPVGAGVESGLLGDGEDFPRTEDGKLRPTAMLILAPPWEFGRRGRGIVGPQYDQMQVSITVLCVAESESNANALIGMCINAFRGFQPTPSSGVLTCTGSAGYSSTQNSPRHIVRFAKTVGFLSSIGALVVP